MNGKNISNEVINKPPKIIAKNVFITVSPDINWGTVKASNYLFLLFTIFSISLSVISVITLMKLLKYSKWKSELRIFLFLDH